MMRININYTVYVDDESKDLLVESKRKGARSLQKWLRLRCEQAALRCVDELIQTAHAVEADRGNKQRRI